MLITIIDTESTGLKVQEDQIIEVGAILYDTDTRTPMRMYSSYIRPKQPLPEDYVSPTGLRAEWLTAHGVSLPEAFGEVQKLMNAASELVIVGHNIIGFDKPIILAELARHGIVGHAIEAAHVIDTRQDLPHQVALSSNRLIHLSAEIAKFVNPFEHRALFDAMSCIKLLECYDFAQVYELSKIPTITMRAMCTYETREKAKTLRFSWSGTHWLKEVRENRIGAEEAAAAALGVQLVRA